MSRSCYNCLRVYRQRRPCTYFQQRNQSYSKGGLMILHRMRTISGGVLIFEAQTHLKMPLPTYIEREHDPICPPPLPILSLRSFIFQLPYTLVLLPTAHTILNHFNLGITSIYVTFCQKTIHGALPNQILHFITRNFYTCKNNFSLHLGKPKKSYFPSGRATKRVGWVNG